MTPNPSEAREIASIVTDEMVTRFLSWKLPEIFRPDCYVTFDHERAKKNNLWPVGTNLLTADQARAMLEHVLADLQIERDDDDTLREMMADILRRTTTALKGEPGPLEGHSWHDLPEVAALLTRPTSIPPDAGDSAKLLIDRLTSAADLLHMTFPTPKICAAIEKDLREAANWIEQHATPSSATPCNDNFLLTVKDIRVPDECVCPQHGRWKNADDINRLVRELDVAWNGEAGAAKQASLCDIVSQICSELPSSATPNDKHEREMLRTIDQRDAAEEALSQAYYLITGRSPDWSSVWGFAECIEEIDEAQQLLRKLIPSSATRKLAERAVESQKNDKRTDEQIIEDGASFICGEGFDPPSSATDDRASQIAALITTLQKATGCTAPIIAFASEDQIPYAVRWVEASSATSEAVASGDWPEDFSHENGNYDNICCHCGKVFRGHKRRVCCKSCASPHPIERQAGELVSVPREASRSKFVLSIEDALRNKVLLSSGDVNVRIEGNFESIAAACDYASRIADFLDDAAAGRSPARTTK